MKVVTTIGIILLVLGGLILGYKLWRKDKDKENAELAEAKRIELANRPPVIIQQGAQQYHLTFSNNRPDGEQIVLCMRKKAWWDYPIGGKIALCQMDGKVIGYDSPEAVMHWGPIDGPHLWRPARLDELEPGEHPGTGVDIWQYSCD